MIVPADAQLALDLATWFDRAGRDLPWRRAEHGGSRDPYRSLVSELMLQQTRVPRVADRFDAFLARFPTVRALAEADEQDVLAAWSGLGYYRRARLLHAAAREVVARFGGEVPAEADALRTLPGVGRYTAGALSSIVFGRAEPMVDANVVRVLLRIGGRELAAGSPEAQAWAWERSAALVGAAQRPGVFNEALMELGSTICTPRVPACASCPVAGACEAHRAGLQARIPAAAARKARRTVYHTAVVAEDGEGRVLLVRRPDRGLWRGLWAPPTVERADRHLDPDEAAEWVCGRRSSGVVEFTHPTTHLEVRFRVVACGAGSGGPRFGRFFTPAEAAGLGVSSAHRRALAGWRERASHPAGDTAPDPD